MPPSWRGPSPRAKAVDSAVAMVLRMKPRSAAPLAHSARPDETDDALALTLPGFEEAQHPLVVRACPGQREADLVGEVIVADTDGVGVAECADAGLGARPWTDPTQAREDALALLPA